MGQRPRRRLHRAVAREPRRVGPQGDGVAPGAPHRHPEGHAGRPGPALPELQDPGPLRARRQRLRRLHLDHQAERRLRAGPGPADHDRGGAQAGAGDAGARRGPRRPAPGRGRPHGDRLQHADRGAHRRARAPLGEVQGGPPRGPEGEGPGRAAREGEARAGGADPRRARRRVHPAAQARGRAAGRHRLAEDAGRQPEPQGDRARGPAQGGRLRQGPLRGAAAEAQRDRHRRLHPQQQRLGGGPGERAPGPGAPPEAAERPRRPPGRAPARAGPRAGARLPRQHHPRPRGDRALPAPRPPRRGAALRGGERLARHRGLPEPAHGAPLRPPRRRRPGGAGHRHRPPGGQDDHDREPRPAPRGVGGEDGGGRLRPAARPDAPAARLSRGSRASPTSSSGTSRCPPSCGRPRPPTSSC